MSHRVRKMFGVWMMFLGCLVAGMSTAAEMPAPAGTDAVESDGAARRYLSVRQLPDQVTVATLDNGLTVIVQENHVAPVATVRCYVNNTGSAFEGQYLGAGVSHVLEHVVAGGSTTKRSEAEIEQIIDTFGGATNAFTSTDVTAYFINCPADHTMQAIELLAESMQHCAFHPEEFARELSVIRQELADGEVNRRRVQWNLLSQTVYQVHPIRHPVIGYLDVLNQTTNEMIIDFYRQRYVPNNQVFVVVGAVDTQAVLQHVATQWAATPRGNETLVPLPQEPLQLSPREASREMDGAGYDLVLAWPTVDLSHPDLYALDVAAYVLAQGESSRLTQRLKYEEPLVLSVGSASYTPHFAPGVFAVFASAQPDTWQKASDQIVREVERLREELVTPEELAKAKKQKAAELVFGAQTVEQAADSLGRNFLATGDPLFDKHYVDAIQQVTAQQVQDVARRYLVPERFNRVIIAPPGGSLRAETQDDGGTQGETRLVQLENGLRVLVKQHTHLPMVNVQALTLGAALVDTPQTAGRASLVASMLDQGTSSMTAQQIAEFFDSIGGQMSMQAGRNTVYGSATVLSDDFDEALKVFAQCFLQPAFPEDQFDRVQRLTLAAIQRRSDDPQAEAFELLYDSLPPESPYHLLQNGKFETVQKLTPADLQAYHQQYFVPQNMIVTVFGDVNVDQAIQAVQQHFGSLPSTADFQPIAFDRPNQIDGPIVQHKQTAKDTGMVIVSYPGTSILDREDYAALTVLDAIMSGYSYPGGWLHNELRGAGLVYFVHAFQMTGPAPGYFSIMAQTHPDQVDQVLERIEANVQRAREGRISEEEFLTAKQRIIALNAQDNTTIGQQSLQAALDELYGLGYDYEQTFDQRIEAVTIEDVVQVANQFFGHAIVITTSPRER
jgi:zinc protease